MKKGFTLVELSIVLVIIGLLIGGILVAQSMISSARLEAAISQIQQFDIGVSNFKTNYKQLPGDNNIFGGGGNNNGLITQNPAVNFVNAFGQEIANFWLELDHSKYPGPTSYMSNSVPPVTSGSGQNVPVSILGKKNSFFIASAYADGVGGGTADVNNPRNYYAILDPTQAQTISGISYYFSNTTTANSTLKPAELAALDTKIDDGLSDSGNVLSGAMFGGVYAQPLASCSSANKYIISNDAYNCTPLIRMGAQTGELY